MSTQNPTYIIWGLRLPYPKDNGDGPPIEDLVEPFLDSAFKEDSVNAKHDTTILLDGMNGEYMIVGHVFKRTDAYGNGFGVEVIPDFRVEPFGGDVLSPFMRWKAGITATLKEIGMDVKTLGMAIEWMVVTHYR